LNIAKGSRPDVVKKQHVILYKCFDEETWNKSQDFQSIISSAFSSLQDGGYLWMIYHEDPSQSCPHLSSLLQAHAPGRNLIHSADIRNYAEGVGFRTIRDISYDEHLTLKGLLFRKVTVKPQDLTHRVIEVGLNDYDKWFEDLKLFLREENEYNDKRIWIVPRIQDAKQQATGITGLVKSLRLEEGGERLRTLIDFSEQKVDIENPKYKEILKNDMVYNVFDPQTQTWGFDQSVFYAAGREDLPTTLQSDSYLRCLKAGDLTSLTWVQDRIQSDQMTKKSLVIDVSCSALNFRDIMFATGQLDSEAIPGIHPTVVQDSILGLEFSGIDQENRRVMGIIPHRGLATRVTTESDNDFIWPVPDDWSLEQAATVPVVYATAYYALIVRGGLSTGDSVLIHSGCGGVGLAALSIATSIGCHVFATCGSAEKRNYLLNRFPQLRGRIFSSRDVCFEEHILRDTAGRGVDAVLNSLSEDKLQASIRCLAPSGRFLEIGKVDFIKNHPMFLHQMSDNRSFHGILLDALFHYDKSKPMTHKICNDKKRVRKLLLQGIRDGVVKPLDATIYSPEEVEHAFRFMASGKHIGKVIIKIRDENNNSSISSIKSTHCHPSKSYIVLGGLGGFGMEVVHFLVSKGARNIMISSRSGIRDSYQRYCVTRLCQQGVRIFICTADITKESGCKQLLEETMTQSGLPIGGIFNIAVVYKDCMYQDQYVSQFREVCAPKSEATIHLDRLSRLMCPELEYFVTFSSISANRGNAGQTNYNFANSLMDSICTERRRVGLPGLSIQWGVVGDVGIVADTSHGNDMVLLGSRAQRMHSCFEVIDMFLQGDCPVCLSYIKADPESSRKESSESVDILSVITRLLGMKDMTSMDPETTLGGLGVDSLIAVEIKQALDKSLGSNVSIKEVRNLSIATLIQMSQKQQQQPPAEGTESPSTT
jgi:fatty acid synthase